MRIGLPCGIGVKLARDGDLWGKGGWDSSGSLYLAINFTECVEINANTSLFITVPVLYRDWVIACTALLSDRQCAVLR